MAQRKFVLPVEVAALEEDGFFAVCPLIQGCHAVGDTLPQALENLEDVARVLLELIKEDGLPLPEGLTLLVPEKPLREEILVTLEA